MSNYISIFPHFLKIYDGKTQIFVTYESLRSQNQLNPENKNSEN